MKVLREQGVATNSTQMPRLLEATGEAGLQFLLAVRRGMLRGDLIKHMGGDHSLLINFRNPGQGEHGLVYPDEVPANRGLDKQDSHLWLLRALLPRVCRRAVPIDGGGACG